jgi:hypothetical protein
MANNNGLFNAALSGAYAGINTSRSLSSAVEADYAAQRASALAFATLLDTAIATGSYSAADEALLQGLVQEIVSGKGEASPNSVLIAAIIAAFDEARSALEPGTPGVVFTNVAAVWYCDAATAVDTPNQTGNIEAPFATIAQAVAAAAAGDLIICSGTFTEDVTVSKDLIFSALAGGALFTFSGTTLGLDAGVTVTIEGGVISNSIVLGDSAILIVKDANISSIVGDDTNRLTAIDSTIGTFTAGDAQLRNCFINGDATVAAAATHQIWNNVNVAGAAVVNDCTATQVTVTGNFTLNGFGILENCTVGGNLSATTELTMTEVTVTGTTAAPVIHQAANSTFTGVVTANAIQFARDSVFGTVALNGAVNNVFLDSKYTAMSGIAGSTVDMDAYSASWAAVTGGLVRSIVAARATLSVNVPVLAANAIGTATQVCTGTVLAGITTGKQIVVNEPTAGVTGGGFLASWRVSATNTILFTFHGPTTGGAQNFVVTQV